MTKLFATIFTLALAFNSAHAAAPFSDDDFQVSKAGEKFAEFMSSFDIEDPKINFEFKTSSTSVGIKLSIDEIDENGKPDTDKLGTWLPQNSAANPETQTVAHYLGQFLHMSDYVVPADYLELGPKATARFKSLLNCKLGGKMWKDNCVAIQAKLNTGVSTFDGTLRDHVKGEVEVPGMIAPAKSNGTLNSKSVIGQFISAAGAMPSAEVKIDLGIKFEDPKDKTKTITPQDTQLNLARQFSKIMVLDVLTGQWDRFSGGNIEAIYNKKKDVVQFLARDNGGASMVGPGYSQYYKFLTRFDRGQIERVERLLALLKSNPEEVRAGLKMRSKVTSLIARCEKLLAHVEAVEAKYGAEKTFFPAE